MSKVINASAAFAAGMVGGAPVDRAARSAPMRHLDQSYRRAGRDAQQAFWGQGGRERQSMLHQLALRVS